MIYLITNNDSDIQEIETIFPIKEIPLEKLLSLEPGKTLQTGVFGEELMFLGRQVRLGNMIFDMLAVDKLGRAVVIELKKDGAYVCTNMQAMGYQSILRHFTGENFLSLVAKNNKDLKEAVVEFVPDVSSLNLNSQVIVIARHFDEAVFSMSRWLAETTKVSFKFIQFKAILQGNDKLISFSTVYNHSIIDEYGEAIRNRAIRKPQKFWHILNDGPPNAEWWEYWQKHNKITLCYENLLNESCRGFRKMNDYIEGDEVFVWANECGLIGYGKISGDYKYESHPIKSMPGHSHSRPIKWEVTVPLDRAISSAEIRALGFGNPRQGKQELYQNRTNVKELIQLLHQRK